jgi:hypothetical protein
VAILAVPLAAQSVDPRTARPERPTVATHAGTVAAGRLEIEAGAEYDRFPHRTHGFTAPILFKVGITPRAQLSLLVPMVAPEGAGLGPADAGVGIKWRLRNGGGLLGDFAVFPSLKFPTGSSAKGRGTGTTDLSLLLISSHTLGLVAVDLNAGITRRSGDGTAAPRTATVWTASFGGAASGALGWVAEVYGYPGTTGPAGNHNVVALLVGPTYALRPWLVFDAGGIAPITGPQPYAVYLGLTWNAGRLQSRPH